jgi:hypothetical protein
MSFRLATCADNPFINASLILQPNPFLLFQEMRAVQLQPGERNYCAEFHIAVSLQSNYCIFSSAVTSFCCFMYFCGSESVFADP